jgi:hypothetical protein
VDGDLPINGASPANGRTHGSKPARFDLTENGYHGCAEFFALPPTRRNLAYYFGQKFVFGFLDPGM